MSMKKHTLKALIEQKLGQMVSSICLNKAELTVECRPQDYHQVILLLRDDPEFDFEQAMDLCGVDYMNYKNQPCRQSRFAVVVHLQSMKYNRRLRVRTFVENDGFPVIDSIVDVYNSLNWFEREAFDLYGIMFKGHPDLRRLLTDYGFIGHPFRKDFPVSGYVEMHYDEEQQRVIYQPITIEPRENTPRIVREEFYGG